VPATRVLWGQIATVFVAVLLTIWTATQWTAWRLGYQPELGRPWMHIASLPLYPPPAFFWWWFAFDGYIRSNKDFKTPQDIARTAPTLGFGGRASESRHPDCRPNLSLEHSLQ
jgi:type IV secretory pathway TraG/TraD family ATPase VirD4